MVVFLKKSLEDVRATPSKVKTLQISVVRRNLKQLICSHNLTLDRH